MPRSFRVNVSHHISGRRPLGSTGERSHTHTHSRKQEQSARAVAHAGAQPSRRGARRGSTGGAARAGSTAQPRQGAPPATDPRSARRTCRRRRRRRCKRRRRTVMSLRAVLCSGRETPCVCARACFGLVLVVLHAQSPRSAAGARR